MDHTTEKQTRPRNVWLAEHASGADRKGRQGRRDDPGRGHLRDHPGVSAENEGVDPQDRIGADLGHDHEERGRRTGRRRIGARQPPVQGHQRGLQGEDQEEEQRPGAQQRLVARRDLRHLPGEVGHVQRAGHGIDDADREQEQGRADEVDGDVVEAGLEPARAAAVQQEPVGGDQHHLEEHEQVEDVARQEGAVDAHELELEQRVEVAPARVPAGDGVKHDREGEHRGQHEHRRG